MSPPFMFFSQPTPADIMSTAAWTAFNPSSTSPQALTSAQCAALVTPQGDLLLRVRHVPQFDLATSGIGGFTVFDGLSSDGVVRLEYVQGVNGSNQPEPQNGGCFRLTVRGSVVADFSTPSSFPANLTRVHGWSSGYGLEVESEFWYMPWLESQLHLGDTCGVRNRVMGVCNDGIYPTNLNGPFSAASGSPLAPITSAAVGGRLDGSAAINSLVDQLTAYRSGPWYQVDQLSPYIILFGDSIGFGIEGSMPALSTLRSSPAYRSKPIIQNRCRSGAKWADLLDSIQVLAGGGYGVGAWRCPNPGAVKAIVVPSCGINDVLANDNAANITANAAAFWAIVTQIFPGVPRIMTYLGPCASNLTSGQQTVWSAVNSASGYGSLLTGGKVDYLVTGHVAALGDGTTPPNLAAAYQQYVQPGQTSPLHMNPAGCALRDSHLASEGLTPAGVSP